MKWTQLSRICATLGLVLTFFLAPGLAHAEPQDITISPTSLSRVIKPGSSYSSAIQIINQGKIGYNFKVYAAPYHVNGEEYTPDFTVLPNAPNVVSWIKFATTGGYIKPGQSESVKYVISMPKNTQPGGYYAVAFAETHFPQNGTSITLNERVGQIFYLQAAGPVVKKGSVVSWQSSIFQKPPLTSILRLENNGEVNFPATINVKVEDIFGQSKYSLQTIKQILPQTIRRVTIPWDVTPSIGFFKVTGNVTFLGQNHVLATKWVLVMSQTVRLVVMGVLVFIIAFFAVRYAYSSGSKRKHKNINRRS